MASQVKQAAWLEWMATLTGGMPRHTCASAFPPDRFYCLLDELPLHLIPARYSHLLKIASREKQGFSLGAHCSIQDTPNLPDCVAARPDLVSRFALQGTLAWVQGDASGFSLPFWLSPRLEASVQDLVANDSLSTLPPLEAAILLAAGILHRAGHPAPCAHPDAIRQSREHFEARGYVPLANLIHPFHIAALRRYYRYMIRSGKFPLGDGQASLRYFAHNEPVARFFHCQIAPRISAVGGTPVKPSYAYFASYRGHAELAPHTDREQCEFTVSVCLDFSPEPERETPWPLRLETRAGEVIAYQALGDALLYRGVEIPHWRTRLPEGQSSTSLFFHYVSENFKGVLQ